MLTIDVRYLRSMILCPDFLLVLFVIDPAAVIAVVVGGVFGFTVTLVGCNATLVIVVVVFFGVAVIGCCIMLVTGTTGIFVRMPAAPLTIVCTGV